MRRARPPRARRCLVALVWVLAGLAGAPAGARELWRSGDRALEWTGSVRGVFTVTNATDAERFREEAAAAPSVCVRSETFPDCPAFDVVNDKDTAQVLFRLRNHFDLIWNDRLSATVVYDMEWLFGFLDTLGAGLVPLEDSFLGAEGEIRALGFGGVSKDHRRWRHLLYRAFVRYEDDHFALNVGRQRIAWGVGRLWNPIDKFNFIPPLAIESDQTPGIDAVEARWQFTGFHYLQAVYAPGTSSDESRYALRFHGVVYDVDVSAMAGVFREAFSTGFDLAGNLGGAAWRIEAVWTDPEKEAWPIGDPGPAPPDPFWQVVVSLDYDIDVGTGIYVLFEHLWDQNALGFGSGKAGTLLPFFESTAVPPPGVPIAAGPFVTGATGNAFGGSQVVSFSPHTTGVQLGYDLTTALRGNFLALWDWEGESAALSPSVQFTGWNSWELTVGAQFFAGGDRSAYGGRPPIVFVLAEWFF